MSAITGASLTGFTLYIFTVYSAIYGFLFFNEQLEYYHYLGTALVFGGVYLVKKYDSEFPAKYFNEFLEYIDTSEEDFWSVVDKHRSPHLWKKIGDEWALRHTASKDGTDD